MSNTHTLDTLFEIVWTNNLELKIEDDSPFFSLENLELMWVIIRYSPVCFNKGSFIGTGIKIA